MGFRRLQALFLFCLLGVALTAFAGFGAQLTSDQSTLKKQVEVSSLSDLHETPLNNDGMDQYQHIIGAVQLARAKRLLLEEQLGMAEAQKKSAEALKQIKQAELAVTHYKSQIKQLEHAPIDEYLKQFQLFAIQTLDKVLVAKIQYQSQKTEQISILHVRVGDQLPGGAFVRSIDTDGVSIELHNEVKKLQLS